MSVSEKTRKALKEFGLTDYEAKVYISLVESGTQTASELSRTASIPYSKIYEILGNLERKGWVETEQGRPSKYYPKAPSTALESSRSRQETTLKSSQSDAMEELQPLYEKKGVSRPDRLNGTARPRLDEGERSQRLRNGPADNESGYSAEVEESGSGPD